MNEVIHNTVSIRPHITFNLPNRLILMFTLQKSKICSPPSIGCLSCAARAARLGMEPVHSANSVSAFDSKHFRQPRQKYTVGRTIDTMLQCLVNALSLLVIFSHQVLQHGQPLQTGDIGFDLELGEDEIVTD